MAQRVDSCAISSNTGDCCRSGADCHALHGACTLHSRCCGVVYLVLGGGAPCVLKGIPRRRRRGRCGR
jgi:hypothetical protein